MLNPPILLLVSGSWVLPEKNHTGLQNCITINSWSSSCLSPVLVLGQPPLPFLSVINLNPQESPQPHIHHYPQQTTLLPHSRKTRASSMSTFKFLSPPHVQPSQYKLNSIHTDSFFSSYLRGWNFLLLLQGSALIPFIHSFTHLINKYLLSGLGLWTKQTSSGSLTF